MDDDKSSERRTISKQTQYDRIRMIELIKSVENTVSETAFSVKECLSEPSLTWSSRRRGQGRVHGIHIKAEMNWS